MPTQSVRRSTSRFPLLAALAGLLLAAACDDAPVLVALNVSPPFVATGPGTTVELRALGVFSDGSVQDYTALVAWSSSDAAIASVSAAGVVTVALAGSATITAKDAASGVSGVATLSSSRVRVASLIVSPRSASGNPGDTVALTAIAVFTDGTVQDYTAQVAWSSGAESVATVSAAGLATLIAAGSATLTATEAQSTVHASATVTVARVQLASIVVSPPTTSLVVGAGAQLHAVGIYSDATTARLTGAVRWLSDNAAVAGVDASGRVTAMTAGSANISATDLATNIGSTAQIQVTGATLDKVVVLPAQSTLAAGTELRLSATGVFTDATTLDLTATLAWTCANTDVATVEASGRVRARAAGSARIVARDSTSGKEGEARLTVTAALLESITVTPGSPTLAAGTSLQLAATGIFSDDSNQDLAGQVIWISSDETIATVSAGGRVVTLRPGGPVTLTARHVPTGIQGTTLLTASAARLISVVAGPASTSIPVGTRLPMTASGVFGDGTRQDLTTQVTWSSADAGTATVDPATGLLQGRAAGTARITATHAGSGLAGTVTLTVTAARLVRVSIAPIAPALAANTQLQLSATGVYDDDSVRDLTTQVTWGSDATGVASVNVATGLVQGLSPGTARITATHAASGFLDRVTATVSGARLRTLFASPATVSVQPQVDVPLTAVGIFEDGSTQELTTQVTWSSADENVAVVGASTGIARGLLVGGPVTLTAKHVASGLTAGAALTLTAPALVSIAVQPRGRSVPQGSVVQFTASGLYSNQTAADLTRQVSWSSNAGTVVQIGSATGRATALVEGGPVTIRAALSGKSDTTTLTVTSVSLVGLAVGPGEGAVLPLGAEVDFRAVGVYSDGTVEDLTPSTTWLSSEPGTVSIHPTTGRAKALIGGTAKLTATHAGSGLERTVNVAVGPPALAALAIVPFGPSLPLGETSQLRADGIYTDGSLVDLTPEVVWEIDDGAIATVDPAGLATGVAYGSTTFTAVHEASGLRGRSKIWVTAISVPRLTAAPTFTTTSIAAGASVTLLLPVTSTARNISVSLYDGSGNSVGSGSFTNSDDLESVTITMRTSCFGTGSLRAHITMYDQTYNSYSQYDLDTGLSPTRYRVYQYQSSGGNLSQYLLSSFPIALTTLTANQCVFPSMTEAPAFSPSTIMGGDAATVTLTTSGDVGSVSVSLYERATGSYLGSGSASSAAGPVTIPMSTSCLGSGTQVYAMITVVDLSGTYSRQYRMQTSLSSTNYLVRDSDGLASGTSSVSSLPFSTAAWIAPTIPLCIAELSGAPAFNLSTVVRGSPLQLSVPYSGAVNSMSANVYERTTSGYLGGGNLNNPPASPGTVNIPTSASAAAGTYYPNLYIYPKNHSGYVQYYFQSNLSTTKYMMYKTDGYQQVSGLTNILLPTVTVTQ